MITLDLDHTDNKQTVRDYYIDTVHTSTRVTIHAVIPTEKTDCDKDAESLFQFLMKEIPALTFDKLREKINALAR